MTEVSARNLLRLAVRLVRRDLGSGRLLVMTLAASVAVASTVAVSLLVARVEQVLLAESSALLAADLAIAANEPPPAAYSDTARRHGLRTVATASLRSVIAHGERLQLVNLRAVGDSYPLRGELTIARAPGGAPELVAHGPPRGELWVDARVLGLLEVEPGAVVKVGNAALTITALLVLEPDRGGDPFALAPHVQMHADDLAATGLVLPGSRIGYTLLVAGPADALARFRTELELRDGDRLSDPREARPELRAAFRQAERFLSLAAFAGVLLATIGIALAALGYREHHEPTVALLKTLGLSRRETTLVLAAELMLLALLAGGAGNALAYAVHTRLVDSLLPQLGDAVGTLPLLPFVHGAGVAVLALAGYALPPLYALAALPVSVVLARDRAGLARPSRTSVLIMLGATLALAPWHIGDAKLVALALAGMLVSGALLAGAAALLVGALGRLRSRTRMGWRFGLANIARRARLSVLQTTALGLGVAVILLLAVVQNDLLQQWTARLPPDAPNQFLINVQPDEVPALVEFLDSRGLRGATFHPMVRGRLTSINGRAVSPDDYQEARARRLADREFNLSWAARPKADNRVVAGRWWDAAATAELSVEEGIAETLGLALGDELGFHVAGRQVRGRVTSLRHVDWDNFEVNFFVVTTPDLLATEPATYITSLRVEPAGQAAMAALVARFPSVTVIDVDALMQQVRGVMQRVAQALLWVFLCALLAGTLVLAAAVQASRRERLLDVVLLKTLGASRRFVRMTAVIEFTVLGFISGSVGSFGAMATGWALAGWVLDFDYVPDWRVAAIGIAGGMAGVGLIGLALAGRALRQPVTSGLGETA